MDTTALLAAFAAANAALEALLVAIAASDASEADKTEAYEQIEGNAMFAVSEAQGILDVGILDVDMGIFGVGIVGDDE